MMYTIANVIIMLCYFNWTLRLFLPWFHGINYSNLSNREIYCHKKSTGKLCKSKCAMVRFRDVHHNQTRETRGNSQFRTRNLRTNALTPVGLGSWQFCDCYYQVILGKSKKVNVINLGVF